MIIRSSLKKSHSIWLLLAATSMLLLPFLIVKSLSDISQGFNELIQDIAQINELDTGLNEAALIVNQNPSLSYDMLTESNTQLFEKSNEFWNKQDREMFLLLQSNKELFLSLLLQKQESVEDFKSHHAVLKNSMSYFSMLANKVINTPDTPRDHIILINQLLQAVHAIRVDSDDDQLKQLNSLKEHFLQKIHTLDNSLYQIMNRHIEIILEYAVESRDQLRNILNKDLTNILLRIQSQITFNNQQKESDANRYRIILFVVSLLLVLMVGVTILKQKKTLIKLDEALNELEYQKYTLDEHAIVSSTDVKGNITYANQKFCDISGYSLEELLGANHRIIKSPEHSPEVFKNMWRTIARGQTWHGEVCNEGKSGGYYWVKATIVPFLNEKGKPVKYVSVRTDITDRKHMEQEMISAREEAEKSNKMKSEFLANMSHEIRTPLNGVVGTIGLLRDTQLDTTQTEYIEAAHRSSEHLLALISDILDLSKIESGNLEIEVIDFDLVEALEDLADLYMANAQSKGLDINWGITADVPDWIKGDRVRIWQILTNLTDNAIKFTESGSININVSLQEELTDSILLTFEVKDTGIGIAEESQQRIFNSFEQEDGSTTRCFGGTGLGLSLSKKLVVLMNGEIGIKSRPDHGSNFWFTIQVYHSNVRNQQPGGRLLHGKKMLIIDDLELNRSVLERFASRWEMKFDSKISIQSALVEDFEKSQSYDLVLVNYSLLENEMKLVDQLVKYKEKSSTSLITYSSKKYKNLNQDLIQNFDDVLHKPLRRKKIFNQILNSLALIPKPEEKQDAQPDEEIINQQVLLVDDNKVNLIIAKKLLEKYGYRNIDIAENGQQAVDMALISKYDLIFMDIQMPVMNGLEATEIIRQHENSTTWKSRIIALTANAFAEDVKKCMDAGMDDYLSKPLQYTALQSILSC